MVDLVKTGIEGLDNLLSGGLARNRSVLVKGKAGTGKSTLGLQYLVHGISEYEENGVLFATETDLQDIVEDMHAFGWPVQELVDSERLMIINPPGGLENPQPLDIDSTINLIFEYCNKNKARRLVIDSLNSLEIMFDGSEKPSRRDLMRFITLLRDLDCTVLLLCEDYEDEHTAMYNYLTHGVIQLYNIKMGASRIRAIEVVKMRGIQHSTLTHSVNIDESGIVVHPHEIDITTTP